MFDVGLTKELLGIVTSIGSALAGLWKFAEWYWQRPTKTRLEAAQQLAKWGTTQSDAIDIRAFGEREQLRLYFKDLTGIDRHDHHAALLRTHAKLGGGDFDWRRLRRIGAYLEPSGDAMVVRDLTAGDRASALIAVLLVAMSAASGSYFIQGFLQVAASEKGTAIGRLFASTVLGVFAVGVLSIACLFAMVLLNMFVEAPLVRRKLRLSKERSDGHDASTVAAVHSERDP